MRSANTFVAIDIGTTKVCTLVGDRSIDGDLRVLGIGTSPSTGVSKGMVSSIQDTIESVRVSVAKAERAAGTRILSAHIGITGNHIDSLNNRGVIAIPTPEKPIVAEDVDRALDGAGLVAIPTNRRVLHVLPRYFEIDGQSGVSDPVGMYGNRLDVETHIITGAVSAIQNLTRCVEAVGVQVDNVVLQPLASSEAVLEDEERRQGVVLADIGGGTTDIAIWIDGSVYHTSILPVGGYHLTKDLVVGLRTPFHVAEDAKSRWGHALPSQVDDEESLELDAFGGDRRREVLRKRLCEIIQARAEEVLEMIYVEVKRAGYEEMISAGLVLTGGSARLPGIDELAEQVLAVPVRVGYPRGVTGLIDNLHDPAYATSVGLLKWAAHGSPVSERRIKSSGGNANAALPRLFRWMGDLVKALLPA
ncbi:MAG TPA: cell division protein FtsA [Dehalococcoidia bacterium]|nr:cell division protein FtsA [Dehalococcoidia bacterium]